MGETKNVSKVVYFGKTLIDLTGDTITSDKLAKGITAHDKSGSKITGTSTLNNDTTDATASESEILAGKTAYARGVKITGRMYNNGGINAIIKSPTETVPIPSGYHDGSGKAGIDADSILAIRPKNIREGVSILGVVGTYTVSDVVKPEPLRVVTPGTRMIKVVPGEGYTHLSEVNVMPVPYGENENAAGGITVTIGNL